MRQFCSIIAIVVLTSASANACINDRELPQHEREFRSQYLSPRMTATEPGSTVREITRLAMQIGGVGMLATAVGMTLARRKAQD